MSPLIVDGEYRGAHASHVHPHHKLGAHRTLLTEALPLLNWLIDDEDVNHVVLGRVSHASGVQFTPRSRIVTQGQRIEVLLVTSSAAQSFVLNVRSAEVVERITTRIRARWEAEVSGTPMLRQV